MIIKGKKLDELMSQQQVSLPTAEKHPITPKEEELIWDEMAFEAGLVEERRQLDRRRAYRRVEDRNVISSAYEEANQIREQAYQEGFQSGLDQASEVVDELRETIQSLLESRETILASVSGDIASLAIEVAERIIKTEVRCDETLVIALVRDTLQRVGRETKSVVIKVHPDEAKMVKQSLKADPPTHLKAELLVMEDPTLPEGSCIVETNSGMIDASFTTQMEILKKLLGIGGTA